MPVGPHRSSIASLPSRKLPLATNSPQCGLPARSCSNAGAVGLHFPGQRFPAASDKGVVYAKRAISGVCYKEGSRPSALPYSLALIAMTATRKGDLR